MTTLSLGKKYQQSNVFVPLGFFIFLNDYLLQYSCLENSKDRRAWQAIVHGVTKSWTLVTNIFTFTLHLILIFLFLGSSLSVSHISQTQSAENIFRFKRC